jgi:hypothetical protein
MQAVFLRRPYRKVLGETASEYTTWKVIAKKNSLKRTAWMKIRR